MAKFLLNDFMIEEHVKNALIEDIGYGDITTDSVCASARGDMDFIVYLTTRNDGVFCGADVFKCVFRVLAKDKVNVEFYFNDGDEIKKGDKIAKISGSARYILTGERLALNYTQRLSGIATMTRKYRHIASKYGARVVDTRKNTPNFRIFEKYAVKVGGGYLHRFNLCDCVMLKDNHIALLGGSIKDAVKKVRENISHAHKIEVECDAISQVKEALEAGADIIMLDNMSPAQMRECVKLIDKKALVEASGGVDLNSLEEIAKTGVDIISTSAIVARANTLDLAFDYIG